MRQHFITRLFSIAMLAFLFFGQNHSASAQAIQPTKMDYAL